MTSGILGLAGASAEVVSEDMGRRDGGERDARGESRVGASGPGGGRSVAAAHCNYMQNNGLHDSCYARAADAPAVPFPATGRQNPLDAAAFAESA
jgi:hypothetical protein